MKFITLLTFFLLIPIMVYCQQQTGGSGGGVSLSTVQQVARDSANRAETNAKAYTDQQFNTNPKGWQTAQQVEQKIADSLGANSRQWQNAQQVGQRISDSLLASTTGLQFLQSLVYQLQNRVTLLEQALGDTTAPTVQIPNAPSNILVNATERNITITWQDNSTNETGFEISRKVSALENWTILDTLPPNTTIYVDSLVSQGVTYDYQVRALGQYGNSGYVAYFGASLIEINYALRVNPASFYVEVDSTGGGGVAGDQWVFNAENNNFNDWNGTPVFGDSIDLDITNVNPLNGSYSYRIIGQSSDGSATLEYRRFNQTFNDSFYIQFRLRVDTLTLKEYGYLVPVSFLNANYTIGNFFIYRWLAGNGDATRFTYGNQSSNFSSNGYTYGDTVTITLFYYKGNQSDSMQTFKMWYRDNLVINTTVKGGYGWGQVNNITFGSTWGGKVLKSYVLIDNLIISTSDPRLSSEGGEVYTDVPIYLVNKTDSTLTLQSFSILPQNIFYPDDSETALLPINILPDDSLQMTIKVLRSGVNGGSYTSTLYFSTQKQSQTYNLLGFVKTPNITPPDTSQPPTSDNVWYLSATGSGTQDGKSRANARLYTNHSTLPIQPGDTVYFVEGIYTQRLNWTKSGSPAGLITLMPDPLNVGEAIFSVNGSAIDIGGRSYLRLYKLKVRNSQNGIDIGQGKVKFLDSLHISKVAGYGIGLYGRVSTSGQFVYDPLYDPGLHSNIDSVFIRWCYVATDTQVSVQTDVIVGYWLHGVRVIGNYLLQGNWTGGGHNDNIQFGHGVGDIYIANNVLINLKESNSQIFMNGNSWAGYKTVIYNNISIHYGGGTGLWQTTAYNAFNPNSALATNGDGEVYLINNTLIGRRIPFMCTMGPVDSIWQQTPGLSYDSVYAVNNIIYMMNSDGTAGFDIPRRATDPINAMYADNNIHAINGGTSIRHIASWYGNTPTGNWTLSQWNSTSTLKMYSSTTSLPTFNNFQYNSALYYNEDLRLTQNSVGVNAGRSDIKIKGNQWVNLKSLIESFGLEWTTFKNPYVSWATGSARSEITPHIGATDIVP